MAQWWERSPPTNVAPARFRPGVHIWVEFVVCSRLAPRVFLRVHRFSSLHKDQHSKFQFKQDIGSTGNPAKADVALSRNVVTFYYYL